MSFLFGRKKIIFFILGAMLLATPSGIGKEQATTSAIPEGFVDVQKVIPGLKVDLRYFSNNNFMGKPVRGYEGKRAILTEKAALALKNVQDELAPFDMELIFFDGYRPQMAVDNFLEWSKNATDIIGKKNYYPDLEKPQLFEKGYIASKSGHSRGSTVDLTIISKTSGTPLDMGGNFDFFGPISHPHSTDVTPEQRASRLLLRTLMMKHGFKPYEEEWWHFTLADEPFPETYFTFPVR